MCSVIQSKKPARCRQPTTSIMENRSTSVPKSIKRRRIGGGHNAEGNHQYGADDRHAGAIDLHPGQLAQGEHKVAESEDDVAGSDLPIGKREIGVGAVVMRRASEFTM